MFAAAAVSPSSTATTPRPPWRYMITDPLQGCVEAMMANSVNDRWLMLRLFKWLETPDFRL